MEDWQGGGGRGGQTTKARARTNARQGEDQGEEQYESGHTMVMVNSSFTVRLYFCNGQKVETPETTNEDK
jgi:hypothetical protein